MGGVSGHVFMQWRDQSLKVRGSQDLARQVEETFALPLARNHDAGQNAVDHGPQQGLVAAADLAGDDGGAEHSLRVVVGRRDLGLVQEHEPFAAMFAQVRAGVVEFRAEGTLALVRFEQSSKRSSILSTRRE